MMGVQETLGRREMSARKASERSVRVTQGKHEMSERSARWACGEHEVNTR